MEKSWKFVGKNVYEPCSLLMEKRGKTVVIHTYTAPLFLINEHLINYTFLRLEYWSGDL